MTASRNFILCFKASLLIAIPVFLGSCGNEPRPAQSTRHLSMLDDSLVNYNRGVVLTEEQQIEDFIARYGWKMNKTPTGLRYMFIKKGNGQKTEKNKIAGLRYTLRLLNGNLCYSSDQDGMKEFKIGYGGVESGLEEGILLMRVGDRVKFIVPSHLAFGLLGDQNRIPQNATLVYDIELVTLK
ncbi:MAG: FKBP-type peptidyl-prolyl cis-trans isomerase [Bacteroidetes bacterium]|nr:FKBP-type peptidyl-prolyl cis-trans isomerase [Bacteroidota bacterium]